MFQGAGLEVMLYLQTFEESLHSTISDSLRASMIFSSRAFPTGMFTYPSGQC